MAIHIVQLGSPRGPNEGLRLGTVRRPPRGVRKQDFAKLNYYDVWLPILSPSPALVKLAHDVDDAQAWAKFVRKFRTELKAPAASEVLNLLAALSHQTDFSLGCYCPDERRCHRSILRELLGERGARVI